MCLCCASLSREHHAQIVERLREDRPRLQHVPIMRQGRVISLAVLLPSQEMYQLRFCKTIQFEHAPSGQEDASLPSALASIAFRNLMEGADLESD